MPESERTPPSAELVSELAAWIDAAAKQALTPYELSNALSVPEAERSGPRGRLLTAFNYRETSKRASGESFFGSMFEFDGHRFPPALADVDPDDAVLWAAVTTVVQSAVARARLNDLCFEAGWGHGGDRGRAAANAYLELSTVDVYALGEDRRPGVALGRVDWLTRALELASKMRDDDLAERAVVGLAEAAVKSIAQSSPEPGVVLGAIEALVEAGRPEADDLLARASETYAGDAWNTDATIELQLRRVGGGR